MKKNIRSWMRNCLYAAAPGGGGLTMYWAIMIGVFIVSLYMVGGIIPKRFPDLREKAGVPMYQKTYTDSFSSLQLRSLKFPTPTPTPKP